MEVRYGGLVDKKATLWPVASNHGWGKTTRWRLRFCIGRVMAGTTGSILCGIAFFAG